MTNSNVQNCKSRRICCIRYTVYSVPNILLEAHKKIKTSFEKKKKKGFQTFKSEIKMRWSDAKNWISFYILPLILWQEHSATTSHFNKLMFPGSFCISSAMSSNSAELLVNRGWHFWLVLHCVCRILLIVPPLDSSDFGRRRANGRIDRMSALAFTWHETRRRLCVCVSTMYFRHMRAAAATTQNRK